MKKRTQFILGLLCLSIIMSCTQDDQKVEVKKVEEPVKKEKTKASIPHNYGGYYCPDNLGGFPAVDISNWRDVPVVNGRMATIEETQNGTSLIFVDVEQYPEAKPLDLQMPKLARYFNRSSGKNELIIVIQALNVSNDSIVGFRYLNGGNGSARLNEVQLLSDVEIGNIASSRFVSLQFDIKASKDKIWKVLTEKEHSKTLQAIFDEENKLDADWNVGSKVNFKYAEAGKLTSDFAGDVWGNLYIQIDYEYGNRQYAEKFLVGENQETKSTELVIMCGPYEDDYTKQKAILESWGKKVKELSEKE